MYIHYDIHTYIQCTYIRTYIHTYIHKPSSSSYLPQSLYPVNLLRNVALNNTRTSYVQILDIDLAPSSNMYKVLRLATGTFNLHKRVSMDRQMPSWASVHRASPGPGTLLGGWARKDQIWAFHHKVNNPESYLFRRVWRGCPASFSTSIYFYSNNDPQITLPEISLGQRGVHRYLLVLKKYTPVSSCLTPAGSRDASV